MQTPQERTHARTRHVLAPAHECSLISLHAHNQNMSACLHQALVACMHVRGRTMFGCWHCLMMPASLKYASVRSFSYKTTDRHLHGMNQGRVPGVHMHFHYAMCLRMINKRLLYSGLQYWKVQWRRNLWSHTARISYTG